MFGNWRGENLKRTKLRRVGKSRKGSLKSLHKKAWALQSEYIRRSEKGICYTCGNTQEWKFQQAGHYIHKDCLDFDSINIHCQCVHCNKWLHGNSGVYAERLIAEYGEGAVAELRIRSYQSHKFNIFELENLITLYQQKLQSLQSGKEKNREFTLITELIGELQ